MKIQQDKEIMKKRKREILQRVEEVKRQKGGKVRK